MNAGQVNRTATTPISPPTIAVAGFRCLPAARMLQVGLLQQHAEQTGTFQTAPEVSRAVVVGCARYW